MNVDLRLSRVVKLSDRVRVRGTVDGFNLANHVNISAVTQRAFLAGTAVNGVTPLVFQNAVKVAAEGLSVPAFGTPTAAGTDSGRMRQVQVGARVWSSGSSKSLHTIQLLRRRSANREFAHPHRPVPERCCARRVLLRNTRADAHTP